ncbi:MAG: hypothetical protein AB7K86_22125, partial [Rhodospirillales bacterium]
ARAAKAGYHVLLTTSDYIPRVGGSIWTMKDYAEKNPETVKKFARAIAKAIMFIRTDKAGSIPVFKEHLGIDNDADAGFLWDQLHNTFGAELPKDLFREIFESRRIDMIAGGQWPKDKPLPDTEGFVTRDLLDAALKEAGYKPAAAKKTN